MSVPKLKSKKLDSLGFDWSNQYKSPAKKKQKVDNIFRPN